MVTPAIYRPWWWWWQWAVYICTIHSALKLNIDISGWVLHCGRVSESHCTNTRLSVTTQIHDVTATQIQPHHHPPVCQQLNLQHVDVKMWISDRSPNTFDVILRAQAINKAVKGSQAKRGRELLRIRLEPIHCLKQMPIVAQISTIMARNKCTSVTRNKCATNFSGS